MRATEARAPSLAFALASVLVLASCSSDGGDDEAGSTTVMSSSDATASTSDATTTTDDATTQGTSTETDTGSSATVTTAEGGSFYAGPSPDGWDPNTCDPFAQDCPEGEKCVPYSSGGGSWDANKCVPILGEGQPGDPCTYDDPISSLDDCGAGSFCFNVDARGNGTCTAFCQGTAEMPECGPQTACQIINDGSITLCLELCDPLLQDCGPGFGCYLLNGPNMACLEAGELPPGEPCSYLDDCAPGYSCGDAAQLPACMGAGCCTSFCELANPNCPPDFECVAIFEPGESPAYEHVGLCLMP